ncbi:MAG: hypothetical protein J1E63_03025, partial [Muribaculaceae bacterium]|nr:hypothetical protein [Muribaculaceae bacterium]
MKKPIFRRAAAVIVALAGCFGTSWAIGGDGAYFVNTFEELGTYPSTKDEAANETTYNVEGQGEWVYKNAYQASNSDYIPDGSGHNLRMLKSGSYVITPILDSGVASITFDLGRAAVKVYTSTDGGATWTEAAQTAAGNKVTVNVGNDAVNRVKVANDAGKDADIDNLAVYATTFATPVTVATGDATAITENGATLFGTITKNEGQTITEVGFAWSSSVKEPAIDDNRAVATLSGNNFEATLSDLRQGTTIYYRAYVAYGDTRSYGEVKSFRTLIDESSQTVDELGRYFVQDWEDAETYPSNSPANEVEYYVPGQGSWLYKLAFQSTNSSYNPNGSTMNLRMPKNGSYVVTPVLNSGVKRVEWDAFRKEVTPYLSTDGGSTWTAAGTVTTNGNLRVLEVNDLNVNRVKLANDTGSDADIDNLVVYAQAYGTPATVSTGAAVNVTKNSADVSGTIIDGGDQTITATGIIWGLNAQPSLADNVITTDDPTKTTFTVTISGLKAGKTVYYRAYALSAAGYAYGDIASFVTSPATAAVVATADVTKSGSKYRVGGTVTDDGGLDLTEVGVIYGKNSLASLTSLEQANGLGATVATMSRPAVNFSTSVSLDDATVYFVRAYAVTDFGLALGDMKEFKTDEVVETPDIIQGSVIWCAPDGNDATADGSEQNPFFDVQKAIDIAAPGDRIWMKAGTYVYDKRININDRNGEPGKMIELWGYQGRAILDFSDMPYHGHSDNPNQGIRLTSSYWHFKNLDITNASDNGLLIERNKPTGGSQSDIVNRTQD